MTGLRRLARRLAVAATPLLTGCLEFADPTIPDREGPALLSINVRAFDTGTLQVDGSLLPGREQSGFLRVVQTPEVRVDDVVIEPGPAGERGVRPYFLVLPTTSGGTAGPWQVTLPDVRGVGPLPPLTVHGLRRVGSDTLRLAAGSDIVLRIDTIPWTGAPVQPFRQWFLDVRSGTQSFRLSGDGAPPPTLRIPAEFVAAASGGRADISLIYYQTSYLDPLGMYRATVLMDVRMNWVAIFSTP